MSSAGATRNEMPEAPRIAPATTAALFTARGLVAQTRARPPLTGRIKPVAVVIWLKAMIRVRGPMALAKRSTISSVEAGGLGECVEIPVAREERNAAVNTALSNQRIAKAGFAPLGQYHSPQGSCTLPIA